MFDWIVHLLQTMGYLGLLILTFVENVFPPIPSEMILPLAGYLCARGEMSFVPTVVAGSLGSLMGAWFWYEVGRAVGRERLKRQAARHGRWLTLEPDDLDVASRWFDRHGALAVFLGRFVPTLRTLISVPAGVARMHRGTFVAYSLAGTAIWTGSLTALGYLLQEHHDRVAGWLDPISNAVFAVIVVWYLYRVATFEPRDTPRGDPPVPPARRWLREPSSRSPRRPGTGFRRSAP